MRQIISFLAAVAFVAVVAVVIVTRLDLFALLVYYWFFFWSTVHDAIICTRQQP